MTDEPTARAGSPTPGTTAPERTSWTATAAGPTTPGASSLGASDAGATAPSTEPSTASLSAAGTVVEPVLSERRSRGMTWVVVALGVALVAALAAAGYLYATTSAYADRLAWTEDQVRSVGAELVATRGELDGARGELEEARAQLVTAQERITALADEKAQIGDDREAQAQLLDYQARVSEAAGSVASALERCVQGQDQLIEYLANPGSYAPSDVAGFAAGVDALCQSASEANVALQTELADR